MEEVKRDAKEAQLLAESFDIEQLIKYEPFVKEIHDGCDQVDELLAKMSDMEAVMKMLASQEKAKEEVKEE